MNLGEPILIPEVVIPEPVPIPVPTLELPSADIPSYTPLYAPPSDLRPPPGVSAPKESNKPVREAPRLTPPPVTLPPIPQPPPEVKKVTIPTTDIEVPIPQPEILVTAATTATVSVAATLTATAIFKRLVTLMKPIIKKILTKKDAKDEDIHS